MSDELCDFDDKHSCASDSIASDISSDESDSDSDLNSKIELREDDWCEEFDEDKILQIQYHDIEPIEPNDIDTPLKSFSKFYKNELWDVMVTESNRYYNQKQIPKEDVIHKKKIEIQDIKAFHGVILCMGINVLPNLLDYFQNDNFFRNDFITKIMKRDEFTHVYRNFHLVNNLTTDSSDKMYKIRPLLDLLKIKFNQNMEKPSELTIDESIIKCKARISFKQYNPMKPIKRGIKVFTLNCSKTGYLFDYDVYIRAAS